MLDEIGGSGFQLAAGAVHHTQGRSAAWPSYGQTIAVHPRRRRDYQLPKTFRMCDVRPCASLTNSSGRSEARTVGIAMRRQAGPNPVLVIQTPTVAFEAPLLLASGYPFRAAKTAGCVTIRPPHPNKDRQCFLDGDARRGCAPDNPFHEKTPQSLQRPKPGGFVV